MSVDIEVLPRDEASLSNEDQLVLESLYRHFDGISLPVDPVDVAFSLKGRVTQVAERLVSPSLQPYVQRWSSDLKYVPTLRAAIRLWKEDDLRDAWLLYRACYDEFSPSNRTVDVEQLRGRLHHPESLQRLMFLLERESFASIREEKQGISVQIKPSVLDAESLASYLALRSGISVKTRPAMLRAALRLEALELVGLRSFDSALIRGLGPLTVFAGPNEAGKSNLVRALDFASRTASVGFASTSPEWRSLRRLSSGTHETRIRLGFRSLQNDSAWVYALRSRAAEPLSPQETLIQLPASANLDFSKDGGLPQTTRLELRNAQASIEDDKQQRSKLVVQQGESVLASLQDLEKFETILRFRGSIASWSFFHFEATALRETPPRSANGHLRRDGANLPAALLSLAERDPRAYAEVARAFTALLPETESLRAERGLSGGAMLRLRERGLTDALSHVDFSDGMLRILALMVLAFEPDPPALVVVEEPENGLYPRLIEAMVDVIRQLARRTQVFLTTHSITLLNRLTPGEVVFVYRDQNGSQLQHVDTRADIKAFIPRMAIGTQMLQGNLEDQS